MPGLVAVKNPPQHSPLSMAVPHGYDNDSDQRNPPNLSSLLATKTLNGEATRLAMEEDSSEPNNSDLGPFLLKLARDTIASGGNPNKALDYAIRASISFERSSGPALAFAMSLHVVAAIYSSLRRFEEAIRTLEQSIEVSDLGKGSDHALVKFSGFMQLGDTYSMIGQLDQSILCYESGLKIQVEALGSSDPRVGQTCRYLAEAHVEAMQFNAAEKLCKKSLDIHKEHSPAASVEEATDRRLMALICEAKGDYECALEHLVLASMAMIANGEDNEVAAIDVSIGNIYLSLCRFDEAIFAYHKALIVFKSTRGENHPSVASIFIRLADLYHRLGKLRESKSYCENAVRIYARPVTGTTYEQVASGFTQISSIYESLNEPGEALKLLQKAMELLEDIPGESGAMAGVEAQMGLMFYMLGRFREAWNSFENATTKLRANGERKSAFLGVILNQMGLACVQLYKIREAAIIFEEAKTVLEQECGPHHLDTLGVCSNLAATYDAMGRFEDAIKILEQILKVREEKLGTANPEVYEERKRLAELLKEAGRPRNRKGKSLINLLDSTPHKLKKEKAKWHAFSFKT